MKAECWKVYLLRKYVNDINVFMEALQYGVRYRSGRLEWSFKDEKRDLASGRSRTFLSLEVFTAMANDIFPSLNFSHDMPEMHPDNKVPMLDIACWRETVQDRTRPGGKKQVVSHSFYEKACVSPKVLEYESALPIKIKIVTLTQEILRRMRNSSRREPISYKVELLDSFMVKLMKSGYPVDVRKTVLEAGLKGYYRMVPGEVEIIRTVNMPASLGLKLREASKMSPARNWYKPEMQGGESEDDRQIKNLEKALGEDARARCLWVGDCPPPTQAAPLARACGQSKGSTTKPESTSTSSSSSSSPTPALSYEDKTESVMFVTATWRSSLVKALQKMDEAFCKLHKLPRIRFVERGGSKLIQVLGKKDPWENRHCCREECWPCQDPKSKGKCRYEGIVYTNSCDTCTQAGVHSQYTGESSRSCFQRSQEHMAGLKARYKDSPMWKHCVSHHNSQEQPFTMSILKKHAYAFTCQVHESFLITHGQRDYTLNFKREWMGESLPRLTIEIQDKVIQTDHDGSKILPQPYQPAGAGSKRISTIDLGEEGNDERGAPAKKSRLREESHQTQLM